LELDGHDGALHDVAWSPAMGRSYHLIATASREKYFRVRYATFVTLSLLLFMTWIRSHRICNDHRLTCVCDDRSDPHPPPEGGRSARVWTQFESGHTNGFRCVARRLECYGHRVAH